MKDFLKKVVFLDRDGVINRDSENYIKNWSEFEFLPGSVEAVVNLNQNGFTVILISNQSAIGRNIISTDNLSHIHMMMCRTIESHGGGITDIFFCPHTPADKCECRKPKPGMILQAKDKYGIDLSAACMVGDKPKDIQCAGNAGCRYAVLVKSGIDPDSEKKLAEKGISADHVAENLFEAAEWIIESL